MWTLVQKGNRNQLFDFVDLANDLGFRDMTFAFSLANWGSDGWREKNDDVTVEGSLTISLAQELIAKGQAMGIRVSFWNSTDKYSIDSEETLCPWPFERAVVTSDLRVVPCCTIGNPDAYEIGRGSNESFTAIWQSEEYKLFRQAHLDRKIPKVCQVCYQNSAKQ